MRGRKLAALGLLFSGLAGHLVMAYSALFNNVFEALNLLLIILLYFQQPGNGIRVLSRAQSSG